jgi:hypothetical protein
VKVFAESAGSVQEAGPLVSRGAWFKSKGQEQNYAKTVNSFLQTNGKACP